MQEAVQTKTRHDKKTCSLTSLDWRRTILVTLPFMDALTFWQAYDGLIPLMLKNTFSLGDTATGFFMALDNILALFMLPLTGYLSDKLDTKRGRRTPFIVVGSLIAALLIPMIAIANTWKNLPLFMAVFVLTLLALSTYRAPSVALMPDVTPRPVRSKADAFISLMAAVGGVIILVAISVLVPPVENPDYRPVYFMICGMVLLTTAVFAACFNKPREVAAMHRESAELGIPEEEIDAPDEAARNARPTRRFAGRSSACSPASSSTSCRRTPSPAASPATPTWSGACRAAATPWSRRRRPSPRSSPTCRWPPSPATSAASARPTSASRS